MSAKSENVLPFKFDENGKRYWDITGLKGELHVNKEHAKVGDLIKDGKKTYEIQKDFSFKRLDKKRK